MPPPTKERITNQQTLPIDIYLLPFHATHHRHLDFLMLMFTSSFFFLFFFFIVMPSFLHISTEPNQNHWCALSDNRGSHLQLSSFPTHLCFLLFRATQNKKLI